MGARRGNALSRSGRFTRIGRGSNSSSTSGPSRPDKVKGGGGIDYGTPSPGQRRPEINLDSFYRLNPNVSRPESPVSPTPGRRGPITRQPVPAPTRPDQRVQPDRVVNSPTPRRGPETAPKEKRTDEKINNTSRGFGNIRTPSQSMDAQVKLLQTEDAQYAKNKMAAARLDAVQKQLDNRGERVGGVGVMGRPDSEINAGERLTTERIRTIQSDLADMKQKSVTQAKAKEMNRGIATRTTSFGRR